jgi:hypothetical protein
MTKKMTLLLLACPMIAAAQNPIISDIFAADPTARVFHNKVYVYPSHDILPPEGQRQDWFCMADYHVFSSENLTDWQDHGMIISQENVPWGKPDGYSMWAPDCVFKDGTYYFYFPNGPKEGRGFSIGVATAKNPEGPFTCEPQPIKGVMGIDPCVLIDDDGRSYLYWSGMGIRGTRLKANMKELDDEPQVMEGLPDGFKEGPFVFRRGDWYYLTFPWVRGSTENGANPTETLAYAMSKSPLGPWDFKGIFMAEHANRCWTNHHSFVEYKGQWYLFYHHNDYSPRDDKRRSARIEKVTFLKDGTIQEIKPTLRGVGVSLATQQIQIDRYSEAALGVTNAFNDTTNTFRGWNVTLPKRGSWVTYNEVDFSGITASAYVTAKVKAEGNGELLVREANPKGKIIARLNIQVISDGQFRRDQRGQWIQVTAPLTYIPKGVCNLCLTCEGESTSIDWLQFKNRERYFTPTSADAAPVRPDADGFLRRWTVLEPIEKPIRSNTIFTDSYLREAFSQSYFKDQMTILPKDGQKVKVDKQTLTWHKLDCERFNLKLFRFADLLKKPTYGVLFWGVTVIDCEEDLNDVRLAAGSNGASMWWLDGQEVLLLSGDRRMVKDDGMSARLTLTKGQHTLRFAVINGPGMSDMCVRFLNENNQPITNFTIR